MTSGDASVPDKNNLERRCEKCGAAMKQLAELPALSIRTAIKVFRCYVCNHVISDRA